MLVVLQLAVEVVGPRQAQAQGPITSPAANGEPTVAPFSFRLAPGQVQTLTVEQIQRVAVGDPEIVDVTIVSATQLLVQAKKSGSTNLILWDAQGERHFQITVVDPVPATVAAELPKVLEQLGLPEIKVELKSGRVLLIGEVATDAEMQVLEQMASTYQDVVVNLVRVSPALPPSSEPAPLVRLGVQVFELNRTDLERIGIDWSDDALFSETPQDAAAINESIWQRVGKPFKLGTFGREGLSASLNALVRNNKARLLSEPTLVTSSGKQASSFIGVEVPVIKDASLQSGQLVFSIDFRKTGVVLKITPTVVPAGEQQKITTVMEAEVSDVDDVAGLDFPVGTQTAHIPAFKVRNAQTEVTTASGETIVIAGLLQLNDTHSQNKVPGLGNIPVLGRLFRSPDLQSSQVELIITVTPELVQDEAKVMDRSLALEQALSVAEVTASVDDPRLRYALQIQQKIAGRLHYPQREKELGLDGTVKLRLHLFADGTAGRVMVAESSGIEAFDLEALKIAESQAPYPGFPNELKEKELWLEIPVIFRP